MRPKIPVAFLLFCCASLLVEAPVSAQVTAHQGEQNPYAFRESMIVEIPFAPAQPEHLRRMSDWYEPMDSFELRKYQCDRIRIWDLKYRVKKLEKDGSLPITIRLAIANPDQNHDKLVEIVLEIHNGANVVGTGRLAVKVEEDRMRNRDIKLLLRPSVLQPDPVTQMRITVKTRDI